MIDAAEISPWIWVVGPLTVVLAYTVLGLSGFGSTVVSVPILAHFLPISYLVPLMAVVDTVMAAAIGARGRTEVSREELLRITPFMVVGFVIGLTVLVGVPDRHLRAALGVFAVAVGVHGIANPVLRRSISGWWCVPTGLIGGAIAAIFGAGGPIYATYLSGRLDDKSRLRSTLSALITLSAFTRSILYAIGGLLLHYAILVGAVVVAPFAMLGLRLGSRIHVSLTQVQMRRVVGALLVVMGLSLLARGLL